MEVGFRKTPKCKRCGEEDLGKLSIRLVRGKEYYRHLCKKCFNLYTNERRNSTNMTAGVYSRRLTTLRQERADGSARIVLKDCKGWDRKHGYESDLDRDFVQGLLVQGCTYCGTMKDRIGLDRVDNAKGHLKNNVVPACTICNLVRGNMPYEAWLVVANGMREARELGLFVGWTPGNRGIQGVG